MLHKHAQLETMIRKMVEENLGEVQDELTSFIASNPEERYKALLQKDLIYLPVSPNIN